MGVVSVWCLPCWVAPVRLVVSLLLRVWFWQLGLAGFCCRFWAALLGVWVSAPGCLGFCSGWGRLVLSGCSGAAFSLLAASWFGWCPRFFAGGFLLPQSCLPIAQSWRFCPSLWPVSLPRHRLASCLGRPGPLARPGQIKKVSIMCDRNLKFFKNLFLVNFGFSVLNKKFDRLYYSGRF